MWIVVYGRLISSLDDLTSSIRVIRVMDIDYDRDNPLPFYEISEVFYRSLQKDLGSGLLTVIVDYWIDLGREFRRSRRMNHWYRYGIKTEE